MAAIRVELEQLGQGQFVEIRDPKFLPWGVQRNLAISLKDESIQSQMEFAEKLSVLLIRNGYVLDEDDKPVQFPLTDSSVQNVPAVVIEAVAAKFGEVRKKGNDLPNA